VKFFPFFRRRKKKAVESTPLSEFVRNTSSAKKKRVYETALKRASESQNKVVERTSGRRRSVSAGA
jgi:hypothetical protein